MTKKSHKWIDDFNDEVATDKRTQKKFTDRRKRKRMKNALRNLNVNQINDIEEDDYYS